MNITTPAFSLAALACLAATANAAPIPQKKLLIRAATVHLDPQQTLSNPSLLLAGGKVSEVASRPSADAKAPFAGQADEVLDFPGAVVTAGFVDAHMTLGDPNELSEPVESFTPELRAATAYDPFRKEWKHLARKGVTSSVYSPNDKNLAGGFACFVKPGNQSGAITDTYLKMSLSAEMLNPQRRPTSLMGGIEYLRDRFDALQKVQVAARDRSLQALSRSIGGSRAIAIACREPNEIIAALDLVDSYGITAILVHATDAAEVLPRIRQAGVSIVLDPLSFSSSKKALDLPHALSKAGVPFAFAGESDDEMTGSQLRESLAIAVRSGLEPKDALATVTTVPASLAGLGDRVGSLFKGRDADLCVWSGEPWNLSSRLLLAVRDGKVAYRAAERGVGASNENKKDGE